MVAATSRQEAQYLRGLLLTAKALSAVLHGGCGTARAGSSNRSVHR